ncbi:hypothetical protein BDV35DRAFT_73357 [Aspergillus flavus]|uniref:Uncharacterized protein n=1 Tax=Aspergillus flavus TaxID=5059 RepID=A0A5N6GLL5_ASPFL|nr:hypothetical protein BDV35DRAFT_73357 [Aspergillus flavus]
MVLRRRKTMKKTTMTRAGGLPVPVCFAASGCHLSLLSFSHPHPHPHLCPLNLLFVFTMFVRGDIGP